MRAEIHDVIHAVGPRDLDRPIVAAVVDDQPFHLVEARAPAAAAPAARSASVPSSLWQGIWMISFFTRRAELSRSARVRSGKFRSSHWMSRPMGGSPKYVEAFQPHRGMGAGGGMAGVITYLTTSAQRPRKQRRFIEGRAAGRVAD